LTHTRRITQKLVSNSYMRQVSKQSNLQLMTKKMGNELKEI